LDCRGGRDPSFNAKHLQLPIVVGYAPVIEKSRGQNIGYCLSVLVLPPTVKHLLHQHWYVALSWCKGCDHIRIICWEHKATIKTLKSHVGMSLHAEDTCLKSEDAAMSAHSSPVCCLGGDVFYSFKSAMYYIISLPFSV
jgi:hypothetical protein